MKKIFFLGAVFLSTLSFAQGVGPSGGSVSWGFLTDTAVPNTDNAINLGSAAKRWAGIFVTTVNTGAVTAPAATGMVFTSNVTDGAAAVGFSFDAPALANGTALAFRIREGATSYWEVDASGNFIPGSHSTYNVGSGARYLANMYTSNIIFNSSVGIIQSSADERIRMRNSGTTTANTAIQGAVSNDAASISVQIGSKTTLTAVGSRILCLYSDAIGTFANQKTCFDKDGSMHFVASATLRTCDATTEGLISRNTATGGTTGTRTSLCICTSDGAGTPAYAWQHLTTGTVGTTTTCAP